MAYTLPEKTATLEFTEYPGLEIVVVIRPVPLDVLFTFEEWRAAPKSEQIAKLKEMRGLFEPYLRSDPNVVFSDWQLAIGVLVQWMGAVAEVPLPLLKRSGAGSTSKARRASKSRQL
jgi:hypothetical protein